MIAQFTKDLSEHNKKNWNKKWKFQTIIFSLICKWMVQIIFLSKKPKMLNVVSHVKDFFNMKQKSIFAIHDPAWVKLSLWPNIQKGEWDLARSQFQEGVWGGRGGGCWGKGGDCFQGDCSFYIKNKLKSEIFNNKKSSLFDH